MSKFVYTGQDNLEVMAASAVNYNAFLQKLATDNIPAKHALCLDFGAGTGTFAELLREAGYSAIECVEPDAAQIKLLTKKGFKVHASLDSVPNKSIDVIYLFNVLEHIEQDHAVVQELAKKLKKGGRILIYVPAFNHLFSSMDKKVGHYRRYTRRSLSRVLKQSELAIISNRYHDPLGYFATLVYKFAGNKNGDLDPKKLSLFDRFVFPLNKLLEPVTGGLFGKNVFIVAEVAKK